MKKQLIVVGIIVIFLIVGLSGCNSNSTKSDEEKLIGIWIYSISLGNETASASYVFLSNKMFKIITSYNGEVYTVNGTWNIMDNKLLITLEGQDTVINDYIFSNNDTKLKISDSSGSTVVFTKQ